MNLKILDLLLYYNWIFVKFGMKTIEERARLAAYQIYEEIGLSNHSVDRVSEIIAEKILEQKNIDDTKLVKIKSSWEREAQINHNDENNYKQGFHDAVEKAILWLKARSEYPFNKLQDSFINFMEK